MCISRFRRRRTGDGNLGCSARSAIAVSVSIHLAHLDGMGDAGAKEDWTGVSRMAAASMRSLQQRANGRPEILETASCRRKRMRQRRIATEHARAMDANSFSCGTTAVTGRRRKIVHFKNARLRRSGSRHCSSVHCPTKATACVAIAMYVWFQTTRLVLQVLMRMARDRSGYVRRGFGGSKSPMIIQSPNE